MAVEGVADGARSLGRDLVASKVQVLQSVHVAHALGANVFDLVAWQQESQHRAVQLEHAAHEISARGTELALLGRHVLKVQLADLVLVGPDLLENLLQRGGRALSDQVVVVVAHGHGREHGGQHVHVRLVGRHAVLRSERFANHYSPLRHHVTVARRRLFGHVLRRPDIPARPYFTSSTQGIWRGRPRTTLPTVLDDDLVSSGYDFRLRTGADLEQLQLLAQARPK
ncbi:hypothetical protein GQ600_10601 [Phytophthora cactorum]|nr:hypothetical protein GQ600_10601 [Phytophthora cactorum]